MIKTMVPNGTLTKKHHRQERKVVSTPPSTGPVAGPRLLPSKTRPVARARRAGGKVRNSIACPTGMISPPPTPCSTRNRTSSVSEPDRPHSADAPVNSTRAIRKVRRVPNRSPIQPEHGTIMARVSR